MKKLLILLLFCCCVSSWAVNYYTTSEFSGSYISTGKYDWEYMVGIRYKYYTENGKRVIVKVYGSDFFCRSLNSSYGVPGSGHSYGSPDSIWFPSSMSAEDIEAHGLQQYKLFLSTSSFSDSNLKEFDSDGDTIPDIDEVVQGYDPNDANSKPPTHEKIYDKSGNEIGKRDLNTGECEFDNTSHDGFYYTKDNDGNNVCVGVADGQTAINLDTDDVTDVKFHYNSSGDIVGADYSKDNVDHIDFPGYWGSFYDSSGNYTGSISNTGSITPSAGSSSGGHASTIGDNLGGNQISNPEFPDTGSTFDGSPLTLPNEPTVNQDNTDLATAINLQSQNIIDVGNNLDSRLQKNNYDRSQQARVINNSLSALREEQITVAQAHLSQDLTLHNDRTQQLNMIDNSIAGLRDDLTQSNNNINSNLSAIKEKLTLESTQKKSLPSVSSPFDPDRIRQNELQNKYNTFFDEIRNKVNAGEAPIIEFDLTPLDSLLFGWASLGVYRLDFNDPNLVLIKNIIRKVLWAFNVVIVLWAECKIVFQFSHNG